MRKNTRLQEIRVSFQPFDFAVICIVGPGEKVVPYIRKRFGERDFQYDTQGKRGAHFHKQNCLPVIWIPRAPRTPREFGTLSHEVLHAVRVMLVDWVGINLNWDTDEVFCHSVGHAVTKILEAVKP